MSEEPYEVKRATQELDRAGVEKYDERERNDSTDDSEGAEWSIQKRINLLAADRDAERAAREHLELELDNERMRDSL